MTRNAKYDEELLLWVLRNSGFEFFDGVGDLLLGWLIELVFLWIFWKSHIDHIIVSECVQDFVDVSLARREVLDSLLYLHQFGVLALLGLDSLVC